jgi:hypothetical protein
MTENSFTNIPGDTSGMQRYCDTFHRSEYFAPETLLLAAILEDAAQTYRHLGRLTIKVAKHGFIMGMPTLRKRTRGY